jgi:hypothetical protein
VLPSLVTPGDYLGRLTAIAELRPDAARAVASAVAGVTACGSFMMCGQLRTSTVRGRKGTPAACVNAGVPRR